MFATIYKTIAKWAVIVLALLLLGLLLQSFKAAKSQLQPEPDGFSELATMSYGSEVEHDSIPRVDLVEECLSDRIMSTTVTSVFHQREFYPHGCIESLMTEKPVMKELAMTEDELARGENKKLLDFILTRGSRLFAILLDIRLQQADLRVAIGQFSDASFGDASLPITSRNINDVPFVGEARMAKPWTRRLIKDFRFKQFEYLAPVFSPNKLDLQLHPLTIFPFISRDKDRKAGAFGEVSQVEIHPAHHTDPILTVRSNVVKVLNSVSNNGIVPGEKIEHCCQTDKRDFFKRRG